MSVEFQVSEKAVNKIKEICEKENKQSHGLRIRAAAGGCSGLQYQLGLDEKPNDGDVVIESHGLKIFIDSQSADLVNEASLDFVESAMGGGFKISNPNTAQSGGGGGCGSGGGGGCGSGGGGGCGSGGGHGDSHAGGSHGGGGCGSGGCGCGA